MQIRPIDLDDDVALRAAYDLSRRALLAGREDMPMWSWQEMAGAVRERRHEPEESMLLVGGYVDGDLVGTAGCDYSLVDNLDKCWVEVCVDPVAQGRGHGRALLAHVVEAAEDAGRTVQMMHTKLPFDEVATHRNRRFAEAAGFDFSLVEVVRIQTLPVAGADLARWSAEAAERHDGYRVETYVDDVPAHLVPGLCTLIGQLVVDAPTGDVEWEEEVLTPERFARQRAAAAAAGRTIFETVALAPDGVVAAQSTISTPPAPRADASQWGTFVHREHRGHRLGLAVKAANLRAVQEATPRLRRVITQNAETNRWMIAVNERMGYEPVEASVELVRRS